jgi:hypothetical protein
MYDHELDRRIDSIARRQRGAFNLAQLRSAGGDDHSANHRIELGRWVRLAPAVLAVASTPGTFERQCWAAVLGEPRAWVGAFAAAHLLEFRGFTQGRPELVVPPNGNARSPIATIHRYDAAAVTKVRGLPVTTRAQTLFDLAPRISVQRLEQTVDDELLRTRLSVDELDERLTVYETSRRAGLPVLRSVIGERRAQGTAPPVSELERRGDRILRRLRGGPTIVAEASFPWLKGGAGRVDRYLPDEGIIVEFDGRRWHARVDDFDRDRWRDNQAVAAGLVPLRFTWVHVTTRPREVLAIIEQTRQVRRRRAA